MTEGGKLRLVTATSAFNMGVDCPDICSVVHFGPPTSAIQCVQESGRGGYNGNPSVALLLCGKPGQNLKKCIKTHSSESRGQGK